MKNSIIPMIPKGLFRPGIALSIALAAFAVGCDKSTDPKPDSERTQLIAMGDSIFQTSCSGCHGGEGKGHSPHTPPLLHSDFLMAERLRSVRIVTMGLPNDIDTATTITVNGVDYVNQGMPAIGASMSDREIAAVLTFLRVKLNDSSSVNCRAPIFDEEENPHADCDIVARPEAATDVVTPAEVTAYRAEITAN